MTFETGLLIVAGILALAALPVVHRIVVGPTILDRAVGSDMLAVLMVMAIAVYAANTRSTYAGAAMLAMTALAFLATVALARFVAREDASPVTGDRPGDPAAGEPRETRGDDRLQIAIHAPGRALRDEDGGAGAPREGSSSTGEGARDGDR